MAEPFKMWACDSPFAGTRGLSPAEGQGSWYVLYKIEIKENARIFKTKEQIRNRYKHNKTRNYENNPCGLYQMLEDRGIVFQFPAGAKYFLSYTASTSG